MEKPLPFGSKLRLVNWDETIFERCLRDGFNVFGSGPTPILLRPEKETEPAPDTRSLGNDSHD